MEEIWRSVLGAAQADELAADQVGAWSDGRGALRREIRGQREESWRLRYGRCLPLANGGVFLAGGWWNRVGDGEARHGSPKSPTLVSGGV
jgi:hypothetical protein